MQFLPAQGVKQKLNKGFTLIELLVVIGILGILAAALVATIDPFEQLKKASDTNTQNALVEYIDAITRYYTTHTAYPWDPVLNNGAACNAGGVPDGTKALNDPDMVTCTTALTGDNELKAAFTSSTSLPLIFVSYDSGTNQTTGCYAPQSKSQLHNANTHWTEAGVDNPGQCDTTAHKDLPANSGACFWCTK